MVYRTPQIHSFLPLKDHFIAFYIYSKGASLETKASYYVSIHEERMAFMDRFPMDLRFLIRILKTALWTFLFLNP
jgi:hypothetical protein